MVCSWGWSWMELNQPYYLNVVLLKIFFKELGRFKKHFFLLSVQNVLFKDRSSFRSNWSNLHFFLWNLILWIKGFFHLKTQNLFPVLEVERDTTIPFISLLISYFGVFGCQKKSNFHIVFQPIFNGFSWENDGLIFHSFIY